jgi:hypothetical protein
MKTIELAFCDAGGGHRAAANALCEVAELEARPWTLRKTNLLQLFAEFDLVKKLTGVSEEEGYNAVLRRGWTLGSPFLLSLIKIFYRRFYRSQVRILERHWAQERPDMVVSVMPHFNRALHDAIAHVMPGVPLVTILTDIADYPPHFWIEERQEQYFICGSDRAREQALGAGHPASHVFQASGMILSPRFYGHTAGRQAGDIAGLGLDPSLPIALMMFGGEGSAAMLTIARLLDESGLDVQLIAVCGKNARLEAELRSVARRLPMHVLGFTTDVARLMQLSDFFIGKPGPGSISEALAMGLPVIVECNAWTMPQERYNAEWVEEHGFGIAVHSFHREIVGAVRTMLDPGRRTEFVEHVKAYENRAVFEIPEILERILSRSA